MLQQVNITNEEALEALQKVDGIMTQVEDGRWFLVEHDVCGNNPLEGLGVGFLSTSRRYFTDDIYKSIDNKEGETFWVPDDFADCDEIEDFLARNDYIYIKVYCYDHGGLSLSRGSVCSWDIYPSGYLYLDKRQVREIFQVKRLSKKTLERAEKLLDGVLKELYGNLTIKDVKRALLGKLFTLKGNENKKIALTYLVTSVYEEYDNVLNRGFNPEKYILVIKIPGRKNLERAITLSKFLEKFREVETDENETREAYKKKLRDELNYMMKVHPDKRKTLKDRPRAPQIKDLDLHCIETYKKVSYSTIRRLLRENKVPKHLVPDVKKIRKEIWNRTKADVIERSVLNHEEMKQGNLLHSGKKDYQSMVEKFLDENPEKRTDFLKDYRGVCEHNWDE